jgi:PAS domain S-box-containing protein
MRTVAVRPTGVERSFNTNEIIVTKTDLRGHVTYANDVFLRVSAYPEHEVIGQPHNVVRHPDMPRCVFKLLWDTLRSGAELFAYIVNLAGDGAHYWVLAHVTPSRDQSGAMVGYHSNRRVPSRTALAEIQPLYQSLLAEERRHSRTPDAVAASTDLLNRMLDERGVNYDQFVWSLTSGNKL